MVIHKFEAFFKNFSLLWIKNRVVGRIRAVSKSMRPHFEQHRSRIVGLTYFVISVILGLFAFTLTREEAIEYWERTFLPSERVIRFALGSRGLKAASEGHPLQRGLRALPSSLDEKGSIWLSADPIWVAAFLSSHSDSEVQPVVYCLDRKMCKNCLEDCRIPPKNWQPMGRGWRAMDKVIDQIDGDLRLRKEIKGGLSVKTRRDPREILY